jgi:tRNA-Thr(GGU) m(6)t(6)A37 methyltransferase TsaA
MNSDHSKSINVNPIGVIHSSLRNVRGAPIQPVFADGNKGVVEVYKPFKKGLKDLEGFERIWLIYWFHKASEPKLLVKPYMDMIERGLFSTRAPCRPNPIGLSAVRLLRIEDGRMYIAEVDILDGSPLLDIKPYVSKFDCFEIKRNGWLDNVTGNTGIADERFFNHEKAKD